MAFPQTQHATECGAYRRATRHQSSGHRTHDEGGAMRRGWAAAITLLTLVAAGPTAALAAPMTDPVDLGSGYVLDEAGALSAADETRAQQRLEQFRAQTGLDLWVVFVDDFTNPAGSEQWANQVAESNGLGP